MRFFLIDRIVLWEIGSAAEAVKNVSLSEDFFDDHFPRRPIMPGVLILEGMAQLAGLLLEASLKAQHALEAKALLTIVERTKFRDLVRPGDSLRYRAEVVSLNQQGGKTIVQATRDNRVVVRTALGFAFRQIDDPQLDQRRAALLKTWMDPN